MRPGAENARCGNTPGLMLFFVCRAACRWRRSVRWRRLHLSARRSLRSEALSRAHPPPACEERRRGARRMPEALATSAPMLGPRPWRARAALCAMPTPQASKCKGTQSLKSERKTGPALPPEIPLQANSTCKRHRATHPLQRSQRRREQRTHLMGSTRSQHPVQRLLCCRPSSTPAFGHCSVFV